MAERNWGNCKSCRYFSSHNPNPADTELAKCNQPELQKFDLTVAGATGCNAHEERAAPGAAAYGAEQPSVH